MHPFLTALGFRFWLRLLPVYAALLFFLAGVTGCGAGFPNAGGTAPGAPQTVVSPAGPLIITAGGSYSGTWSSHDPKVPAVTINTDEPVTLHDATLTSAGDLIDINGSGSGINGANVTIKNVTGTSLDPGVSGLQRGSFVSAGDVSSLVVQNCSMIGVSFGVKVLSSTLAKLTISKNLGTNLEDRASDGNGGLLATRPNLGHFIYLYEVSATAGAEIGWNQMVNTIGDSSTEDVINLFKSQGAPGNPLHVHDNYMEGYSSTTTASYTGAGLITDGDSSEPETAFVAFDSNQMVHTAGSGLEIAAGHDITAENNRVVSCGIDANGNWYAMPFVNAVVVWNYYGASDFENITVKGTGGGMLRPSATDQPIAVDLWARTSDLDASDSVDNNAFTDPCLVNGGINLQAEDAERAAWAAKIASAAINIGAPN